MIVNLTILAAPTGIVAGAGFVGRMWSDRFPM
jgi:hypothetical protein